MIDHLKDMPENYFKKTAKNIFTFAKSVVAASFNVINKFKNRLAPNRDNRQAALVMPVSPSEPLPDGDLALLGGFDVLPEIRHADRVRRVRSSFSCLTFNR